VNIATQGLSHLSASDIRNGMKSQAIVKLIDAHKILPNTIDNQMEEFVLLVEEERHGEISNLLLRVFGCGDQVDGFEVTKVDVPAENIDVQQLFGSVAISAFNRRSVAYLADVFLLGVAVQAAVPEFLPDIGQLLVDALLLELARSRIS
jgi:hypothetical protein